MNRAARRAAARDTNTVATPPILQMQVRSVTDSDDGLVVEGSANDTGETDSYRTRFVFTDDCISESQGGIVLFNHDVDTPIGRNLEMGMRRNHLWVRDVIDPGAMTPNGRSIPDLIRTKVLQDFSIRFDNEAAISFGRDFDTVTPGHLPEHSIVTLPSNRGSTMSEYMRSVLRNLEKSEDGAEIARVFRIGFAADHGRTVTEPEPSERREPIDFVQRDIGPLDFQTLSRRLHELLDSHGEYDYYAYPVAVYEDAVVYNVRGRLYRRSFTVDAAGEVTLLDDETEVLMKFEDAMTTGTPTRSEGAALEVTTPVATPEAPPADPTPTEPATVQPDAPAGDEPVGEMTLDELREALSAEMPDEPPAESEPEALSLEELQAGLTVEPETAPAG